LAGLQSDTTRSRAKRDALLSAGAPHVVVLDEGDPLAGVRRLTDGRGVSLVYDGVGGPWLTAWGEIVARHGWYVLYGLSGGAELRYPAVAQFRLSWRFHLYVVLEFTGSASMGLQRDEDALQRGLRYLHDGLSEGSLRVLVDRVFDLREAVDAHRYLARGQHIGKVVMTV
jgi:NADPH:quinone reductase-like Zn-dependent oxidoreductase